MALGERNNVRVRFLLPWMREYAFLDTPEYLADGLLITREVPVRFRKGEYAHPDFPYVVVSCRFNARYEDAFLKCMADLERRIVMSGMKGYAECCDMTFGRLARD